MAKGDSGRSQNQINNQGTTMQDSQNALMNQFEGQNQQFGNNYGYGAQTNMQDYNQGQNNYGALFNALGNGQVGNNIGSTLPQYPQQGSGGFNLPPGTNPTDPQAEAAYVQYLSQQPGADPTLASDPNYWIGKINDTGGLTQGNIGYWNNRSLAGAGDSNGGGGGLNSALESARSGFQNFADTGGFTPQQIQDLRSRASSAVRSNFQTAQANLDQNRALQGFSPNYAAATTNLARNEGYANSDALTNANASIAQMIQSGKLSGLQGLTGVSGLNMQGQQNNIQDMLAALNGSTNLYGSTPGLANTFGNQYLSSGNQLGNMQGYQNQLGLGLISGQNNKAQIPGDFQQALGNIGSIGKDIGGVLSPFGSFGTGGNFASQAANNTQNSIYSRNGLG